MYRCELQHNGRVFVTDIGPLPDTVDDARACAETKRLLHEVQKPEGGYFDDTVVRAYVDKVKGECGGPADSADRQGSVSAMRYTRYTIGTCTMVWAEARFLPLISEQLALIPGPHLLLWTQGPWQWLSDEPVPFQDPTTNPVHHWLQTDSRANVFEVVKLHGGPAVADDLALEQATRNIALAMLADRGVDVCLWFDSDYLMRLQDVKHLAAQIPKQPPRAWSIPAFHFWRDFERCHAISPARLATTTAMRYPEAFSEPDALIEGVRLWHASYVLSDAEAIRKFSSWGHAGLAKHRGWAQKWIARDDAEWNPQTAPEPLPYDILERLERYGCLEGL